MAEYNEQNRGSSASYTQYYAGMDKTMRQKVALICSHFPPTGEIADMGCGSGRGSYDLASLYPSLNVVGVDISPQSIEYSQKEFKRDNLSFLLGDIADPLFAKESIAGFLNSSVLHHVTSFNGFSLKRVHDLLDHETAALANEGILAIRDFVIPEGPKDIVLELPNGDGQSDGPVATLSTSALFKRFCATFKCGDFPTGGIPFQELKSSRDGYHRFQIDIRRGTEFILRKDYRGDWDVELLEEYLYFSQKDFEKEFLKRGLRLLLSRPIYNSWIIQNRWAGKIGLFDCSGSALPFPPTNYMIIGQKVPEEEGVQLRPSHRPRTKAPSFLKLQTFQETQTEKKWDLVSRPYPTVDLVPWFIHEEQLYVVGRNHYPRPIIQTRSSKHALETLRVSGYISEPLTFGQPEGLRPSEFESFVIQKLKEFGLQTKPGAVSTHGMNFFPSPGTVSETVQQVLIEVEPCPTLSQNFACHHGFKTPAKLRAFQAQQTLRAYQAGGMIDHRLELSIYTLARSLGHNFGPWMGEVISQLAPDPSARHASTPLNFLQQKIIDSGQHFKICSGSAHYLETQSCLFDEVDFKDHIIAQVELEFVRPISSTVETITVVPVRNQNGQIEIGLEFRQLPAVQALRGKSALLCIPAWRLSEADCLQDVRTQVISRFLNRDFHVEATSVGALGSAFFPSPGTTPEVCTPFWAVIKETELASSLDWVSLTSLLENLHTLESGHLITSLLRFEHALKG